MMRKIYHNLAKITLLVLLATSFYFPGNIQTAHAEPLPANDQRICDWVNAQNGSVGNANSLSFVNTSDQSDPAKKERQKNFNAAYEQAQKDKQTAAGNLKQYKDTIVVITEEALGTPGAISTNCARQTKCSVGFFDTNNKNQIRKCFTTYTKPDACTNKQTPDAATLRDQSKPLEYCEIVQIYYSSGGTSLLYGYIGIIYKYMAGLGSFIAVLMLIVAGVMRSAAGDKPDLMTKANQLAMRCITGLIVLFLSAVILYTINPNFFVLS